MSASQSLAVPQSGGPPAIIGNIVAFTQDESTQSALAKLVENGIAPNSSVVPGGLSTAVTAGAPECAALLVDISDSPDPVADIIHLCERGARHVVATGPVNDVSLYRALIEAGAADYVVFPMAEAELARALTPRQPVGVPETTTDACCATAVIGARGGVGASTVAVSAAWMLAHEYDQRTALLDLDLQFGTCALALDLLPGRGLREVLENPERIDSLFVASAMVNESENLFVLGGEEPLEETLHLSPGGIETLFAAIQPDFKNIVIDLPRSLVTSQRSLLERMTKILLVSDFSLSGMRDTVRIKGLAAQSAPEVPVDIIVVESRDRKHAISKADFERGIETKIAQIIPFDSRSVGEATNNGKAIPASAGSRRPLVKSLRRITQSVVVVEEQTKKRNSWFRR